MPYPSGDPAFRGAVISIKDLYTYLHKVGQREPGRVREVGIFSHAFTGGPVLYNTYDASQRDARDPTDLDGRIKDFRAPNLDEWSSMPLALSRNSVWYVWGCFHDPYIVKMLAKARGRGEEEWFEVAHGSAKIRTHRTRTRLRMMELVTLDSYPGALSQYLGSSTAVRAPPPGLGASRPSTAMSVNWSDTNGKSVGGYLGSETPFSGRISRDAQGYIDYSRFLGMDQSRQPQGRPRAKYYETWDEEGDTIVVFWNLRQHRHAGAAKLASAPLPDAGSISGGENSSLAGKSGYKYTLAHNLDPALSEAFLVVDEQNAVRVFKLERDGNGQFSVLGPDVT